MQSRVFSALAKPFARTHKNNTGNKSHVMINNIIACKPRSLSCDVFINHRSIDTKKTVAGLLYYHLTGLGLRAFLDSKSMKPGDSLYEKIDAGIRSCRVGVAVFSPSYCESKFCLHELALLMESKKRVIPIFCDVKPSELRVTSSLVNGSCSESELERYRAALEEAKLTVGVTFDCANGYVY